MSPAGGPGPGRLLIVNADDYGLTRGVCRAIVDAHRHGIVTSTSVLALAPAFDWGVGPLTDHPDLGVGAHLALVGEDPPLLSAREVPSLVDRRGRLHASWRTFLPACARRAVDPDDVRRELAAQLERIRGAGLRPDHLDTHQNVHLWPMVRRVVMDLGDRFDIRVIRITRSSARSVVGQTVRRLARQLEARCDADGWAYAGASTGLDEAGCLDRAAMVRAIDRLGATGAESAELATHPGEPDDRALERYAWAYRWADELDALRSPEVRAAVDRHGFRLGTFADLAARAGRGAAS